MTSPTPNQPPAPESGTPLTDAVWRKTEPLNWDRSFGLMHDHAEYLEKRLTACQAELTKARIALGCAAEALEAIPVSASSPYWRYRNSAVIDARRSALNPKEKVP